MTVLVHVCLTSRSGGGGGHWERQGPDRDRQRGRVRGVGRETERQMEMHDLGNGIINVISPFTTATFISGDL